MPITLQEWGRVEDSEFIERLQVDQFYQEAVKEEINVFYEKSVSFNEILLFPPSIARHRYLVHEVVRSLDFIQSVSIGEEDSRRVVIYLSATAEKSSCHLSRESQKMSATKGVERTDGGYLYKGTISKPSHEKVKRPEREVYVPRHRRQNPSSVDSKEDTYSISSNGASSLVRINPVTGRAHRNNGLRNIAPEKDTKRRLVSSQSIDTGFLERRKHDSKTTLKPIIRRGSTDQRVIENGISRTVYREKRTKKLKDSKASSLDLNRIADKCSAPEKKISDLIAKFSIQMAGNVLALALQNLRVRKSPRDTSSSRPFLLDVYACDCANRIMQNVQNDLKSQILTCKSSLSSPFSESSASDKHLTSKAEYVLNSESSVIDTHKEVSQRTISKVDSFEFYNEVPIEVIHDSETLQPSTKEKKIETIPAWSDNAESKTKVVKEKDKRIKVKDKTGKKKTKLKTEESKSKSVDVQTSAKEKHKTKSSNLIKDISVRESGKIRADNAPKVPQWEKTKVFTLNSKLPHSGTQSQDDDWDTQWDDDGKCLDPTTIKELAELTGITKPIVKRTKIDYHHFTPQDVEVSEEDYGHIIEINDFSKELRTSDICMALSALGVKDFNLQWVDDTHALAVFSSVVAAQSCVGLTSPMFKLTPISKASRQSKLKARLYRDVLLPYKPRPETSAFVARNLVTSALGIKSSVGKQQRADERKKLRDAKEKKREKEKARAELWGD